MKYFENRYARNPSASEILVDTVRLSTSTYNPSRKLMLQVKDILGGSATFYLNEAVAKEFISQFNEVTYSIKDLTPEQLKFSPNEYKQNHLFPKDQFQIKSFIPNDIGNKHISPRLVRVHGNMIDGCLEYNAYVCLKFVVDYSDMSTSLKQKFDVERRMAFSTNMDVWVFLNKQTVEKIKESLDHYLE